MPSSALQHGPNLAANEDAESYCLSPRATPVLQWAGRMQHRVGAVGFVVQKRRRRMESYSKTDEVLALLNKHERGEASSFVAAPTEEESLGFTDFLPSPAAAVFHKLQRVSAQPRSEQPVPSPLTRTASEALKVVLGEQRPAESRKLR